LQRRRETTPAPYENVPSNSDSSRKRIGPAPPREAGSPTRADRRSPRIVCILNSDSSLALLPMARISRGLVFPLARARPSLTNSRESPARARLPLANSREPLARAGPALANSREPPRGRVRPSRILVAPSRGREQNSRGAEENWRGREQNPRGLNGRSPGAPEKPPVPERNSRGGTGAPEGDKPAARGAGSGRFSRHEP
jgi:hypothetical protein